MHVLCCMQAADADEWAQGLQEMMQEMHALDRIDALAHAAAASKADGSSSCDDVASAGMEGLSAPCVQPQQHALRLVHRVACVVMQHLPAQHAAALREAQQANAAASHQVGQACPAAYQGGMDDTSDDGSALPVVGMLLPLAACDLDSILK